MGRLSRSAPDPLDGPTSGTEARLPAESGEKDGRLRRAVLPDALPARSSPTPFFDPAGGSVRRIERSVGRMLSRWLFPWFPGAAWPCSTLLRHRLSVSEAQIEVRGLAPPLDGVTVLLLTDIHAGPFLTPRALRAALDRLLRLAPDAILLGGDLVTSRLAELVGHLPALRALRAPLGVFAVLGNHDHYTGAPERLRGLLEKSGVRVLHNGAALLARGSARLALAGIDDLLVGEPDLEAALEAARRPEPDTPVVLLSHNPDVFPEASRRGVPLVLSGHTHGGQVRVPGLPVLVRMSRYRLDEGRYRLGDSELVVSRGVGISGIPLRVACPPEAVFLTLRSPGGTARR